MLLKEPFFKKQLKNGLTLLGEPNPEAETVALGYFVRTGTRDEIPTELGISHFIEHLLFKGSPRLTGRELGIRFDHLGANVNAFTSQEVTVYHAACLSEHWQQLLKLLSELLEPAFRPEDINTERKVVLEELAMEADDPGLRIDQLLREYAFPEHPLSWPILGTSESLTQLSPEQIRTNFLARYGAPNITLVACGKFNWEALVEAVTQYTHCWPKKPFARQYTHLNHLALNQSGNKRQAKPQVHIDPELNRTHFAFLAPGFAASHPLRDAATVLAEILGGDNGNLYWTLIDSGLADSASLIHTEFDELGTFEGNWTCDPNRARETLDLVQHELQKVQKHGITKAEWSKACKKLAVSAALSGETPYSRLFSLGMDYLTLGRALSIQEAVSRFEKVSFNDIHAILEQRPFDRLTLVALSPIPL